MSSAHELVEIFKGIGLEVNTSTKARGHQGFYVKNRIDVSKNISPERMIPTLLHEFAHYIHSKLEPFMEQSGGTIEAIFDDDNPNFYVEELIRVTNLVDTNSKFEKLKRHKKVIKEKLSEYENVIKKMYPSFQRSKKFKEFDNYIKGTNARYLLKYDRIKLVKGHRKVEYLCIDNLEKDFCEMPKEFAAYIRLKSCQRRQARISSRISRLNRYYTKPTELFARFIEGLYLDNDSVKEIAPNCYKRFFELLNSGYYRELSMVLRYICPTD